MQSVLLNDACVFKVNKNLIIFLKIYEVSKDEVISALFYPVFLIFLRFFLMSASKSCLPRVPGD
jgi:type II secretory pathway component PulF